MDADTVVVVIGGLTAGQVQLLYYTVFFLAGAWLAQSWFRR